LNRGITPLIPKKIYKLAKQMQIEIEIR